MPRAEVVEYFRTLFRGKLQRTPSYAWDALASAVAGLPAPELLEDVRQANEDGLLDFTFTDLEDIEREMNDPKSWRCERQNLIENAIDEMAWWHAFHAEDSLPRILPQVEPPLQELIRAAPPVSEYVAQKPFVRGPKIGRNDPCSCGSGRKFKKCCGKG